MAFQPEDKPHNNSVEILLESILRELKKQTHMLSAIADTEITNDELTGDITDDDNL